MPRTDHVAFGCTVCLLFSSFFVFGCLHSDKLQKIYKSQWEGLLLHAGLALSLDSIKE